MRILYYLSVYVLPKIPEIPNSQISGNIYIYYNKVEFNFNYIYPSLLHFIVFILRVYIVIIDFEVQIIKYNQEILISAK